MIPTEEQRLAARQPGAGERLAMRQRWEDLLFLHWQVPADTIQERLPPGLKVDTFEGEAYIGVVPFAMRRVRPKWFFPVPWLSNFLELNVRTYVHDERGVPGVWFFSLDANQPIAVTTARRWFHLPYQHAKMSAVRQGDRIRYRCRRRGREDNAEFEYLLAGDRALAAEPGTLEFFLLERYVLFSWHARRRRLFRGQVAHPPYRFEMAPDAVSSAVPLGWEGIAVEGAPLHSAVAHPVDIEAYALRDAVGFDLGGAVSR